MSELRKRIVEVFEQSDLDISDWAPRAQGELADSVLAVMDLFDVLVSALEAALADGGLLEPAEFKVKEALKLARGEELSGHAPEPQHSNHPMAYGDYCTACRKLPCACA